MVSKMWCNNNVIKDKIIYIKIVRDYRIYKDWL